MPKFIHATLGVTIPSLVLVAVACSHQQAAPTSTDIGSPKAVKDAQEGKVLTGKDALGDWTTDAPGVRRHITISDLPKPYDTKSVDNGPPMIPRPSGAVPKVPKGFVVSEYITGLNNPREIVTAPNGDLFIAESDPGRIRILRGGAIDSKPEKNEVFASGLNKPFGIAFYPPGDNPEWVYIGNTDAVVRFKYKNGDLKASGQPEMIAELPGGGRLRGGGHWTRDVRFRADGKKMYVSVGSRSNVMENDPEAEVKRADILEFDPDGKNERIYASGIRNAVGLAIQPETGQLWCSVNERDGLGDHLVPDYVTRVKEDGFYGWPWFYMGGTADTRATGSKPELKDKVLTPDVLIQSHSASLCMTFYVGSTFPDEYKGDAFAAQHGSWNRARRTGYKVVRIPLKDGAPTGEYEDFMTGFVTADGEVWGRPVGVTTAKDGALMVTDDGSGTVWRVQKE